MWSLSELTGLLVCYGEMSEDSEFVWYSGGNGWSKKKLLLVFLIAPLLLILQQFFMEFWKILNLGYLFIIFFLIFDTFLFNKRVIFSIFLSLPC